MPRTPWYKLDREPPECYAYFKAFRLLDPADRNIARVVRDNPGRHYNTIKNWHDKYNWRERVNAWDLRNDARNEAALTELQDEVLARERDAVDALMERAWKMINTTDNFLVSTVEKIENPEQPGELMQLVKVKINAKEFQLINKSILDLLKFQRLNVGLPTSYNAKHVDHREVSVEKVVQELEIRFVQQSDNGGMMARDFDQVVLGEAAPALPEGEEAE